MSPARKKRAKKSPKRAARKVAKKAARRPKRRKPAAKRAPRKAAGRKAARRKVAKKAARKKVAKKRPALKVVKRAAKKPAAKKPAKKVPPAFAGAKANATAKELVLFELERSRVAVHAALQGHTETSANAPLAPGKWSPRQYVLHLAAWDREALRMLEPAFARNQMPNWPEDGDAFNATILAPLDHHTWDEARRLMSESRADLLAALEAIPDAPAEVWAEDHAVGNLARAMAGHDRHHADKLKAARIGAPPA